MSHLLISRCPLLQPQRRSTHSLRITNGLLRHCQNTSSSDASKPNSVLAPCERQRSGSEPVELSSWLAPLSSNLTLIPSIVTSSCETLTGHCCNILIQSVLYHLYIAIPFVPLWRHTVFKVHRLSAISEATRFQKRLSHHLSTWPSSRH